MELITIANCIIGAVITAFMGLFAYVSSHMVHEKKVGHYVPLPWEKKGDERSDD